MTTREGEECDPASLRRGVNLNLSVWEELGHGVVQLQSHEVEDTADIQIHDLLARPVWRCLEWSAPCCAGVCDKNIELGFDLLHLVDQRLDLVCLGRIAGDADRFALDAGESV